MNGLEVPVTHMVKIVNSVMVMTSTYYVTQEKNRARNVSVRLKTAKLT